jgi:hypothetical protein
MTTDDDRGAARHAETFSTLSDGAKTDVETAAANWRMTTIALLVVSLFLVILYSSESLKRQRLLREQAARAEAEVEVARDLLAEGDLPNAVLALHDAGMHYADGPVEGAESTALSVKTAVADLQAEVESRLADSERAKARARRQERALTALLGGQPAAARRALGAVADADGVSRRIETLAERLERLDAALAKDAPERERALRAIAADWSLAALGPAAERAAAEARGRRLMAQAAAALERGQYDAGKRDLAQAAAAAGLGGLAESFDRIRMARLLAEAEGLERDRELAAAASLFRAAAALGDEVAARRAEAIEREVRAKDLSDALKHRADRALEEKRYEEAAAFMDAFAEVAGVRTAAAIATRHRAAALREAAENYFAAGKLEAARVLALDAASRAPGTTARLIERIDAAERERAEKEAVRRAGVALQQGAFKLALSLVPPLPKFDRLREEIVKAEQAGALERAEAALSNGAPGHALSILAQAGMPIPPALFDRIRAEIAAERRTRVAALLQLGEAGRAAAEMKPEDRGDDWAALRAQVDLRTGDVAAGLALLPADHRTRALALLDALAAAPDQAGKILEKLEVPTEWAPDVLAAIAVTLEARGDKKRANEIWAAIRDEALRRAPLPKPEDGGK